MEEQSIQIREQQKASWNRFSSGWKKWDELNMEFLRPVGEEMIRLLHPQNNDFVLDIAAGTGEPGLTIATLIPEGKVMITDLSPGMLEIAKENALHRGIQNIETKACDVCELPFADNTFDAVSCRFGFMFFPDMLLAVKEMSRVLKPGGRIVATVWNGPEKNFWVSAVMDVIKREMNLPVPPSGSPGIFRCAKDGLMTDLFLQAGFTKVVSKEIPGKLKCDTVDVYWSMMTELAAPVVSALTTANDKQKEKMKNEVYSLLNQKFHNGNLTLDSSATLIYGEK